MGAIKGKISQLTQLFSYLKELILANFCVAFPKMRKLVTPKIKRTPFLKSYLLSFSRYRVCYCKFKKMEIRG